MKDSTKAEYRKLAKHFYNKHDIKNPTPKQVCDALQKCAPEYRPAYWRRLKLALSFVAREEGFHKAAEKIRSTKNPVTSNPNKKHLIKKKQKRQKSIHPKDEEQLMNFLFQNRERATFAAVTLVSHLGCRPSELRQLRFLSNRYVVIPSAKKTKDGSRGLDRIIEVNNESLFLSLKDCHQMLMNAGYTDSIRYVQRRLDIITKRLWPKRKVHPSLYSWRHQLGADLKASELPPEEIAAIMGHQSTKSVEVYGNPRNAHSSRSHISPDGKTVKKVMKRNKHRFTQHESHTEEKIQLECLSSKQYHRKRSARFKPSNPRS